MIFQFIKLQMCGYWHSHIIQQVNCVLSLTHIPISNLIRINFFFFFWIKSSRISCNTAMNTDLISMRFAEYFHHRNIKHTHNKKQIATRMCVVYTDGSSRDKHNDFREQCYNFFFFFCHFHETGHCYRHFLFYIQRFGEQGLPQTIHMQSQHAFQ